MSRESLLREVRTIFEERRLRANLRADVARAAYLAEHEDLALADRAVQEARWAKLSALTTPGSRPDELDEDLEAKEEQLEQRLQQLGLDEEALAAAQYECPTCQDRGATLDGEPCPACYAETLRGVLQREISGYLPEATASFANYSLAVFSDTSVQLANGRTSPRRQMEQNLKIAQRFVEDFPKPEHNLYFTGQPGTGKTYLASCIANALLDQGRIALLLTMLQFEELVSRYRTLQRSFGAKPEALAEAEGAYDLLLDADLLILDDFGVQARLLPEPLSELMMLLQQRKIRGRQTILTSNMNLRDVGKHYDERLLSRILERFAILPFLGDDLRLRKGRGE